MTEENKDKNEPSFVAEFLSQPTIVERPERIKVTVDGENASAEFPPDFEIPAGERELLEACGLDPDEWELVGNQGLTDHRDGLGERIQVWYKPKFRRKGHGIDWDLIARDINDYESPPALRLPVGNKAPWFNVQFGDIHIGKSALAGGGAEQIITKFRQSVDLALDEFEEHIHRQILGGVCVSFVGDLIEGYVSQGGRNIAQTDLNLAKQATAAGKMMDHAIRRFADYGLPTIVPIIGGNHDETTRVQNTDPGDNYATMIASFLQMQYSQTEAYEHVEIMVPPEGQGHMTINVGDTSCVYVHGHTFGGGNIEKKIQDWWSGQALHGRAAGGAQVLACGHFHSFRHLQLSAYRTAIMSPALEIESSWLAEMNGSRSKRGCVTYTTKEGDVQNVCVV